MRKQFLTFTVVMVMCIAMIACTNAAPTTKMGANAASNVISHHNVEPVIVHSDLLDGDIKCYIEPIEDIDLLPLVELRADWTDNPAYAVMAADGTLLLYTNIYEDYSGEHDLVEVKIKPSTEKPIVDVDYSAVDFDGRFVHHPDLAVISDYEETNIKNVVVGMIPGIDETPREYYIICDRAGEQIGVVPVERTRTSDRETYDLTVKVADNSYMHIVEN